MTFGLFRRLGFGTICSTLAIFAGCGGGGDELPRQAVSGAVKLDGQPLKKGAINFEPDSPTLATNAGGMIENGSYSIPKSSGPVPGTYKVSIYADSGIPLKKEELDKSDMPGMAPPPNKELVPPQYNAKTTLKADVKADATNKFDFDLKGAK